MKRLLTILLLVAWGAGLAQDTPPAGLTYLHTPNNVGFAYNLQDSVVWMKKGSYGWTKLASHRDVTKIIDSVLANYYTKIEIDSILSGIRDTLTLHADTIRDHELRIEQLELIDHPAVTLTTDDSQILSLTGQDLTFNSSNLAKLDEPTSILNAIKTVDGAGSGLDADLVDGLHGSYYDHRTFGLGLSITSAKSDLNLVQEASFYRYSNSVQNTPNGDFGVVLTIPFASTYNFQLAGSINAENLYIRNQRNGTFYDWHRLWHSGNMLNPLTPGSIGPAGTFLKSVGSTVTPDWGALSTNDLSDHSNIAFVNTQNSFTEEQRIKKELPGQTLLLEIENTGLTGGSSVSVKNQMNEFFFGVDGAGDFRIRNQTNATTFFRADGATNDIVLSASFDASSYLLSGTEVISSAREINATKYLLNSTTVNSQGTPIQTPSGTSITWDWTQGDWGEITLSGNTTITITNMPAGKGEGLIEITNPASYTVTIVGSTGYTTTEARGSETDAKINGNCTLLYWRVGSTLYYGFLY